MEKETTISVYEFMGSSHPQGRTTEDGSPSGETFRKHLLENWDKYEKINISFDFIAKMTRTWVDEAFAKILEEHSLEDFNQKLFFPDAKEFIVQELNQALKLRLKIIASKIEREKDELSL